MRRSPHRSKRWKSTEDHRYQMMKSSMKHGSLEPGWSRVERLSSWWSSRAGDLFCYLWSFSTADGISPMCQSPAE